MKGILWLPEKYAVAYLGFIEIFVSPLMILYCLYRGIHYSRMAEKLMNKELFKMNEKAYQEALEEMPRFARSLLRLRRRMLTYLKFVIALAWTLWIILVFVIITMPL